MNRGPMFPNVPDLGWQGKSISLNIFYLLSNPTKNKFLKHLQGKLESFDIFEVFKGDTDY